MAQNVIEQEIPKDPLLNGQVTCEAVRWDDPTAPTAMPATLTPQEAVNRGLPKPSQCDGVVMILWSRMGTPLPEDFRKADGSPYFSGTEWEYEDALQGNPQPHILIYRRTSKPFIDPDQPDAGARLEQRKRVLQFFDKFKNPDGSLRGGFAEYDATETFRDRLRNDIRAYVRQRLTHQAQETSRSPEKAPPPFGEICRALWKGRVVLFIGDHVTSFRRSPDASLSAAEPKFLPNGDELSHLLADDMALFHESDDRDDLAQISSYYETFQGRSALRERLRQLLAPKEDSAIQNPPLYHLLAEIPTPLLILTTGFDAQIEQVFRAAGKPYDLVIYPADRKDLAGAVLWWPNGESQPRTLTPNELDIDLTTTTVIFKMHGSVRPESDEWDGFVITEDDHVEFLSRVTAKSAIPSIFFAHLRDRSLLFVGCSLNDWNMRIAIRSLSRYFARRAMADADEEIPSWAVNDRISELEVKLWSRRGVYPFQIGVDEFVAKLRERAPK